MAPPRTVIELLTIPNPVVTLSERHRAKSTSVSKRSYYPTVRRLKPWTEFSIKTLQVLFDKRLWVLLKAETPNLCVPMEVDANSRTIVEERSIEALVLKWNHTIIDHALSKTAVRFLGQNVHMVIGPQSTLTFDEHKTKPDWGAICDRQQHSSILPGDSKCGIKWHSSHLDGLVNRKRDFAVPQGLQHALWPIRQVLYYCISSNTRYGYIITHQELVVLRCSYRPDSHLPDLHGKELRQHIQDNASVEYRSISWHAKGNEALTVNLAIYVLHILATNNGQLTNEPHGPYCPLIDEKLLPIESQPLLVSVPSQNSCLSQDAKSFSQQVENDDSQTQAKRNDKSRNGDDSTQDEVRSATQRSRKRARDSDDDDTLALSMASSRSERKKISQTLRRSKRHRI
ncbi:hypothetical protein EJ05DRAFT_283808 [Pseudovirgaria hyperparasitica]|uniref:Uncharacterized protein n=1 Tax=Pseudovirgaria hyperparasitica TaxID=470096 RepID=A0A6A6WC64_9PEZI|nr:uncharacterized protein EJ05DRAFT_283808 [Pseudovirgaria hyperparasitica]KAF2760428.1 hypothetical protein EJ05DRAFT_283808 [Pseudovirgaria hyperparasitica]